MASLMDKHYLADEAPHITGKSLSDVTEDVCRLLERRPTGLWWSAFCASLLVFLIGAAAFQARDIKS